PGAATSSIASTTTAPETSTSTSTSTSTTAPTTAAPKGRRVQCQCGRQQQAQAEQGYPLHDEPPVYFGVAVVALAFNSNWVTPAGGWKTKSLSGGLIKKSQPESSAMKIGRPGSA